VIVAVEEVVRFDVAEEVAGRMPLSEEAAWRSQRLWVVEGSSLLAPPLVMDRRTSSVSRREIAAVADRSSDALYTLEGRAIQYTPARQAALEGMRRGLTSALSTWRGLELSASESKMTERTCVLRGKYCVVDMFTASLVRD
jgi:hypothetical protein